jgi:hypothetical protein
MSKDLWGPSIWFLFHTLAEKLKPENESEVQIVLFHFKQVCFNLPCPSCQKHATETLQKASIEKIKTREELKQFFWEFHNLVNKRLNKPIFSKNESDNLYKKANTLNVVNHFITVMKSNQIATERTMMNTMTRHLCVDGVSKYIRENGYKFNA